MAASLAPMLDEITAPSVRAEEQDFLPEHIVWPNAIRAGVVHDRATDRLLSTEVSLNAQAARDVCCGQTGLWRSLRLSQQNVTLDLRALKRFEIEHALRQRLLAGSEDPGSHVPTFLISAKQAICPQLNSLLARQRVRIDLGGAEDDSLLLLARDQMCSAFVATSLGSFCEPLGLEIATTPSPLQGLLLPAAAAPLVLSLDIRYFVDKGVVDQKGLSACVEETLVLADDLIDSLCWPLAVQSWDVFLNRRLALLPVYVGQCVIDQKLEPASNAAIALVGQVLTVMSCAAGRASARLAKQRGNFPAMSPRHVLQGAAGRPEYSEWRLRWLKITARQRYRHRQAIFLSLSELWPKNQRDDPAYIALLPPIMRAHGLALGQDWSSLKLPVSALQRLLRLMTTLVGRHKLVPAAR